MSLIDMSKLDRVPLMLDPADDPRGRDDACRGIEGELLSRGCPPPLGTPPSKTVERRPVPADTDREPCLEEWGLRL